MSSNQLKENLKKLLFERDLTPTELSRRVDIPQQTIQRIVKGKITRPHPKTIHTLAEYFGIPIEELQGQESIEQPPLFSPKQVSRNIKVYSWGQLHDIENKIREIKSQQEIFVGEDYSLNTFGVIMADSSMIPYFPKDSILIIDREKKPIDRSFVVAYLHDTKKYIFRQLLSDGENLFLKALNSDLSSFPIRKLTDNDKIIGELVETRQIYAKYLEESKND